MIFLYYLQLINERGTITNQISKQLEEGINNLLTMRTSGDKLKFNLLQRNQVELLLNDKTIYNFITRQQ